ncbi:triosephosphate isomerase [Synergistales bacterium]|nr:triosephosphate isomerase [Synergistales bacterium]
MRKPIIAGNWKLNKTPSQTVRLIEEFKPLVREARCEVVVCPTSACLFAAREALKDTNISLGAQNVFYEDSGAYTGEVACDSLLELGVKYVIIGHSERRQYFAETDETVNKKVLKTLEKRLKPIVCVGESLAQKQFGVTEEVVRMQTRLALSGVGVGDVEDITIAYEPIWAIGAGMTASSTEANDTIRQIRRVVAEIYTPEASQKLRIIYGGSMNARNAKELLSTSDIDGGLIGGASLKGDLFAQIVNAV